MSGLNPDQQRAVDGVIDLFLVKKQMGATVKGEGGTGKTYSVMWTASKLLEAGKSVLFMAPTNKALKQLEKSARRFGLDTSRVRFATLHKALGLALLPDEERKFSARLGNGFLEEYDVAICDEGSMLSRIVLMDHLLPRVEAASMNLLIMMDDMQLPPVKESHSVASTLFPEFRLTIPERQAEGGSILTLTGALRTAIEGKKRFKHPDGLGEDVGVVQAASFLKEVAQAFDAETDLDEQRVLAWRNVRVNEINHAIRSRIYGKDAPRFVVGERVVTGAPITEEREVLLSTDEECIVEKVFDSDVWDEESGLSFKTHALVLKSLYDDSARQVIAHVLHASEEEAYWDRLNELAAKAKKNPSMARAWWAKYHQFKEQFADIRYCYCITVHRSQGSTYDKAFVDVKDILRNKAGDLRRKLLYVSYSRPRSQLVLNKGSYVA